MVSFDSAGNNKKRNQSPLVQQKRLEIGAISTLGRGNSQLPMEELVLASPAEWTASGCSVPGCPQVLPPHDRRHRSWEGLLP